MAEDPWQESLDLDDTSPTPPKRHRAATTSAAVSSSSHPFLRRCSLPQSSQNPTISPRLIPGPAGTVQSAMFRRKNPIDGIGGNGLEQEIVPTQEYIRRAVEDGIEDDDGDFSSDPWLSAVDFVRVKGMVDGDGAIGVPLSAIKGGFNMDKVAQVVALVKSCTPNGLGGSMVTLKDPTGTLDATIHGRVLTNEEFGKDISNGAVIILRQVTLFSPSRSAHYLNITLNNMVKVFNKDARLSMEHNSALPMIELGGPVNVAGQNVESRILQKPSQGMTEGIMNSLVRNKDMNRSLNNDSHVEISKTAMGCHSDGKKKNQNAASGEDQLMATQDADNEAEEIGSENTNKEAVACEQQNNRNPSSQAAGRNMFGGSQAGSSAVHLNSGINNRNSSSQAAGSNTFGGSQAGISVVHLNSGINNQENGNDNGSKGKQPTNASVSLPEWTDEQLDELFAFD
ncbi:hypothetical protein M5689_022904 [Euphorbia peplus]|nr:hypothetical protein M5689_022904 [Euphorbia peplus]